MHILQDTRYKMDLAKRDKDIQHLQNIVKEKERFLYDNHKTLTRSQKDNPFLKDVVDQYTMYFSEINQQNQAQYKALKTLADYMTQLILDPTTDADMIRQCKQDLEMMQQEINLLSNSACSRGFKGLRSRRAASH